MKRVLLYIILTFILFVSSVIARIDKSAVNTALDFHNEGLLASTSTDVEALNDAVFFFERAVRLQPRNATMWHDLGVAHMRTENWINADDCFLASMELSEKKMISRGSSEASVKRAESIYKSAKDNRAEIAVFLDAINKNNQANLFTSSSSSRGVAGVKDQFKFARSYSRLLSGRSVGVADGLADEFDDDNFDADADNNEEVYQEFGAFLLCFRREQRHIYSTYSNSPLISVIPSAFLFSSPNPLYQAQSIPSLIRLHELNSWQTVRRRKVEETRDEVSRKGRWWQAWTPSYLAKHYGHLIVSAHTQIGRLNLDKNCSSEMMKQLILSVYSSSLSTSSLSMIRMTLVEASDEIEILSKMVSQQFTSKTRKKQVRIDNHLDMSTNSQFFKSRLLYRLGFSATIQSLLSSHQDNNTETNDEFVKSPRNTLIPSVLMDVGLPLDEWSHMTHELGKLPPLLGRDRDDPVLSCLIRMSIPNEKFEQVDFSTLSAAIFPIVSEFIIWTKWRRLMMVTPGGQAVNIGYIDKENKEGEKEKFDKNNVKENITLQKKESSLGEWHLQIAGTSRWTFCQRVTNDTFSPLNEPSLHCVKTLVTGGEIVYIPHDWIVLSTVTTESPVASIFLSGRVFITTMEKEKRGNGESLLRRELKRLEDLCKREIEMEEVPRVSYQVCQLLYKAMRSIALSVLAASTQAASPWPPSAKAAAAATLAKMTSDQKFTLVHGWGGDYVGDTPPITLSDGTIIPGFHYHDGPQGVANGNHDVTCWPSALTAVQTWDPLAMASYGQGMGREQFLKGTNVMLGPGVNLARVPWNGRNFEYQGEDDYLAMKMVHAEVIGIQSQNISGCVKHYVFNNEEDDRSGMSSNVPDRPAHELYYKPFSAAVDAGVGVAMCSYNRVNGTWACEDANSLGALKNEYGFEGYVQSDWGATHSTVAAALNGLDQQMPDDSYFGKALQDAVANGQVPQSRIDDMVMRILTPAYALNIMAIGNDPNRNTSSPANPPEHATLARELAEKSIVLLKNNGILPAPPANTKKIVIFGDQSTVAGGGSGHVECPYVITPYAGIATYLNGPLPPSPPAVCSMENDIDYYQASNPSQPATSAQDCCNICSADTTCNAWTYDVGTCWMKPNAQGRVAHAGLVSGNCTTRPSPPVSPGSANVTYSSTQDAPTAVAMSSGADLVVMVVATDSSEGGDRGDLFLPSWQDAMASALGKAGLPVVVVARCPGACHMPWANDVQAILYELLPGQESGNSIANTIFGDNNPSGRLPVSFPNAPASGSGFPTETWLSPPGGGPVIPTSYPGTDRGRGFPEVDFAEGLFMGYRWYDQQNIKPQWSFGHGLSYSTFTYSNLAVSGSVSPSQSATIYANICNTAGPAGSEVAQLYLAYPAAANEPPKLLKGFQKVSLAASGCNGVGFDVSATDISIWNVVTQAWEIVPGSYGIMIGSSSIDIRLTGSLTVTSS